MRSTRWQAQGNVYLVTEEPLTADAVRAEVGDADGILEVSARGEDWLEIVIWNPDGSQAELSGNGTRIAARWLAEQTGAELVTVRVGPRVPARKQNDCRSIDQCPGVSVKPPRLFCRVARLPNWSRRSPRCVASPLRRPTRPSGTWRRCVGRTRAR